MTLRVEDLSVRYGERLLLDDVSIGVDRRSIVVVRGGNGAGKSTLLHAIAGALDYGCYVSAGSISWNGKKILGQKGNEIVKEGICMVPQSRGLFASLTVKQNIELAASGMREPLDPNELLQRVCIEFPMIGEYLARKVGDLSAGQQQIVAMGRAISMAPSILLLDEPTSGLSQDFSKIVYSKIVEARRRGMGILMTEHRLEATDIADASYQLAGGRVTQAVA